MTRRHPKADRTHVVQVGTHRGGHAFVEALAPEVGAALSRWTLIDAKPARAAELAARIQARFPAVHTDAQQADGRSAVEGMAADVVIATVDTLDATRALIQAQHDEQAVCFQLVGRGPGPAVAADRLGIAGLVRDGHAKAAARLLLDGFGTISAAASSRALTAAGDPMSAAMLQPMRLSVTRQTARSFADLVRGEGTEPTLMFFTSAGHFPLTVLADTGEMFSVQKTRALAALDAVPMRRMGIVAAVALVGIEERAIDVLFVARSREDRRRVIEVTPFRAPAQRYAAPAVFTD